MVIGQVTSAFERFAILPEVVRFKSGVSPSMALRLAIAFDTSPESWLKMQQQYDLYRARKNPALRRVKRLKAA